MSELAIWSSRRISAETGQSSRWALARHPESRNLCAVVPVVLWSHMTHIYVAELTENVDVACSGDLRIQSEKRAVQVVVAALGWILTDRPAADSLLVRA